MHNNYAILSQFVIIVCDMFSHLITEACFSPYLLIYFTLVSCGMLAIKRIL